MPKDSWKSIGLALSTLPTWGEKITTLGDSKLKDALIIRARALRAAERKRRKKL